MYNDHISITGTPEEAYMYNPDLSIVVPGAVLSWDTQWGT